MNGKHIGAAFQGKNYEPQRANNGYLYIPSAPLGFAKYGYLWDGGEAFLSSLRKCALPKHRNNSFTLQHQNQKHHFPASMEIDSLEVVFGTYTGSPLLDILHAWRNLVADWDTGAVGWKRDIIADGIINLIAPDGQDVKGRAGTYELHGMFPLDMDDGEIDYDTDDQLLVTVIFSVDKVHFNNRDRHHSFLNKHRPHTPLNP